KAETRLHDLRRTAATGMGFKPSSAGSKQRPEKCNGPGAICEFGIQAELCRLKAETVATISARALLQPDSSRALPAQSRDLEATSGGSRATKGDSSRALPVQNRDKTRRESKCNEQKLISIRPHVDTHS